MPFVCAFKTIFVNQNVHQQFQLCIAHMQDDLLLFHQECRVKECTIYSGLFAMPAIGFTSPEKHVHRQGFARVSVFFLEKVKRQKNSRSNCFMRIQQIPPL